MSFTFFPKVIRFFDLFRQQNEIVVESAQLLDDIFGNYTGVAEKCGKIVRNELAGNDISREISKLLAQTFITPIDREDIYDINMAQEKVINSIRAVSTRIGLYHFDNIKPGAAELVSKIKFMHEEISVMMHSLRLGKHVDDNISRFKSLKVDADMLLLISLGEIYEGQAENNNDFMEIIKWSHIYDRIEGTIACTEFLANVIEGIALKHA